MNNILNILFWVSLVLIVYTYLGYPLILILIAAFKKDQQESLNSTEDYLPSVTLIIAAYNEQGVIKQKIENSLALDYPQEKFQIIVAADGSTDQTVTIANQFSQFLMISYSQERAGKVKALMNAKTHVKGDIIVISDANNFYQPDTIKNLIQPFQNPQVGGVSGAKHIYKTDSDISENEGLYWKYEDLIKTKESYIGACMGSCGEILAIRKEYFDIPDVREGINDDSYLLLNVYKNNKTFLYQKQAKSFEKASETYQDEIGRRKRMAALRFNTLKIIKKPFHSWYLYWSFYSHKITRLFLPIFMILLFISNILLIAINHSAPIIYQLQMLVLLLQCIFYLLAFIDQWIQKKDNLKKITSIARFLVISNVSLLLGLWMSLTKTSSSVWKKIER